jgi:ectoine hydroxylase-related dioxygenase (phytanoyl-CoA dioxygenase family)
MAFSLFRNFLTFSSSSTLAAAKAEKPIITKPSSPPKLERRDATDPSTTTELLVSIIERDGGVIVENIISQDLAMQIKSDLKPYFDTDRVDPSGFFPHTTQRATGLLAKSDACVELACNPTYINVANAMVSSTYTYWSGDERETVTSKPIISSTVGFRVNPGGRQQGLHRDDRSVKHKQVLPKCLRANLSVSKVTITHTIATCQR